MTFARGARRPKTKIKYMYWKERFGILLFFLPTVLLDAILRHIFIQLRSFFAVTWLLIIIIFKPPIHKRPISMELISASISW